MKRSQQVVMVVGMMGLALTEHAQPHVHVELSATDDLRPAIVSLSTESCTTDVVVTSSGGRFRVQPGGGGSIDLRV